MRKLQYEQIGAGTDWKAVIIAAILIGLVKLGVLTFIPW